MRRPIARIRINAGNPGWYDSLTNIHLTISRPEAIVFEGSNTTNIKKGVAYKLISVVDGDLDVNTASLEQHKEEVVETVREEISQPIVQEKVIEVQEPVEEPETKVEEETITEPVAEIVEETVTEEVSEEKPKKKSTKKKTTTKKEN